MIVRSAAKSERRGVEHEFGSVEETFYVEDILER